jgi:Uma2 family endonuclease
MNRPIEQFQRGAVPARFTAAEFLRMAELGAFRDMKVELDHGEIVRMTPPYGPHAAMQAEIIAKLYSALQGSGLAVIGEVAANLGFNTVRALDLAVLKAGADASAALVPSEILIGVEVAASSIDYDLGPKLRDYAAAGVGTYWVVDVNARVVHVMSGPADGTYRERHVVRYGEPLAIPGSAAEIVLD